MDKAKDLFSARSAAYAVHRPRYPQVLYDFLLSLPRHKERAWDCGTGNGQVAGVLADHFQEVQATDISESQLKHAVQKHNIVYSLQRAEQTLFPDQYFDLVTVAQAIHWFDFNTFYAQVKRTLKPQGVLAVIGYSLCSIDASLDAVIQTFYQQTIGPYWDPERRYLDEGYQTIPFPFQEIVCPQLHMEHNWTLADFMGYISTWSAVQHYIRKNKQSPLEELEASLSRFWPAGEYKQVQFPLLLRVGTL